MGVKWVASIHHPLLVNRVYQVSMGFGNSNGYLVNGIDQVWWLFTEHRHSPVVCICLFASMSIHGEREQKKKELFHHVSYAATEFEVQVEVTIIQPYIRHALTCTILLLFIHVEWSMIDFFLLYIRSYFFSIFISFFSISYFSILEKSIKGCHPQLCLLLTTKNVITITGSGRRYYVKSATLYFIRERRVPIM